MAKERFALVGAGVGLALALSVVGALAGGYFTNGVPVAGGSQYPTTVPLTGNETIPADTNLVGGQMPQSEALTVKSIAAFAKANEFGNNLLIGGDAGTNLWQRGTTGASVTTTATYGGPDRWVYWSGTNTAVTVSKSTTASDLAQGFSAAFKFARTSGQTGLVQSCMAQEIETSSAVTAAGQTVEFSFNAYSGANFSPTNQALSVYVVYGTGSDEGTTNLAFGLNGGGGGAAGWTGQANAVAASIPLGAVSTAARLGVVANIPATAKELAVAVCFTPTGTAGTNDYVALSGLQMIVNNAQSGYASASVGYVAGAAGSPQFAAYARRATAMEAELQQRYAFVINEASQTAGSAMLPGGMAPTATTCLVYVPFPVPMRTAPTYTNALTASTFQLASAASAVALSTPFSATTGANNVNGASVTFTASTLGATAGFGCLLESVAGVGQMVFSAEL